MVEVEGLAKRLGAPDLAIIDASWYMPQSGRQARAEYEAAHIPGAVFFDIDAIADHTTDLPHMLPDPLEFSKAVGALGLGDDMEFVVYDGAGLFSAARVWWMLKTMGARKVRVLNGGLPKWQNQGRPVEAGAATPDHKHFTCRPLPQMVRSGGEMRSMVSTGGATIVDARAAGRFAGRDPEPRPGLPSGHIPGSKNVPFNTILNPDGTMKQRGELAKIFNTAGVALDQPVVTTCGSGVTAAVLYLGLTLVGATDLALYDGSWAEWGAGDPDQIATA
ncbi:MAG: 3-mercaptopyruvate sulfurtransferase [Alphaproteobacteria bacterium]